MPILPLNSEEVVFEQELQLSADKTTVLNLLADINNYSYWYPLFTSVQVLQSTQMHSLVQVDEFVASSSQYFGHLHIERHYNGVLMVNRAEAQVQLRWQRESDTIILDIALQEEGKATRLKLKTTILSSQEHIQQALQSELAVPAFRLDILKMLLEEGVLIDARACDARANRFCF